MEGKQLQNVVNKHGIFSYTYKTALTARLECVTSGFHCSGNAWKSDLVHCWLTIFVEDVNSCLDGLKLDYRGQTMAQAKPIEIICYHWAP